MNTALVLMRLDSDVTELNWHDWTDQWASRASPFVIGWRVRERSQ